LIIKDPGHPSEKFHDSSFSKSSTGEGKSVACGEVPNHRGLKLGEDNDFPRGGTGGRKENAHEQAWRTKGNLVKRGYDLGSKTAMDEKRKNRKSSWTPQAQRTSYGHKKS